MFVRVALAAWQVVILHVPHHKKSETNVLECYPPPLTPRCKLPCAPQFQVAVRNGRVEGVLLPNGQGQIVLDTENGRVVWAAPAPEAGPAAAASGDAGVVSASSAADHVTVQVLLDMATGAATLLSVNTLTRVTTAVDLSETSGDAQVNYHVDHERQL